MLNRKTAPKFCSANSVQLLLADIPFTNFICFGFSKFLLKNPMTSLAVMIFGRLKKMYLSGISPKQTLEVLTSLHYITEFKKAS